MTSLSVFFFSEVIKILTTKTMGYVKHICFNPTPSDGCLSSSAVPLLLRRVSRLPHVGRNHGGKTDKKWKQTPIVPA